MSLTPQEDRLAELPPLPTFLIIGAQKSGTRWLRHNLGLHPEVFTPDRELHFFDSGKRLDLDAYRSMFRGWGGEPHIGEATPGYMILRNGDRPATTIHTIVPEVRLLAILRNPVDRTYSAFKHQMRRGRIPADTVFLDRVRSIPPEEDHQSLIAGGWYAGSLRIYRSLFGDRLRVLLLEEVGKDPHAVYRQALGHIGAADLDLAPPDLARVRFSNPPPPGSEHAERDPVQPLTRRERSVLYDYFRHDMLELERDYGLDLDVWRERALA